MKHKTTAAAYQLLQQGQEALADVEHNGVRVDKAYLDSAIETVSARIADLERDMAKDEVCAEWKKECGDRLNLGSRTQLAKVLFDRMGLKPEGETASGRWRTDKAALDKLDLPFVKTFVKIEELKKALSTYLIGLRKEIVERDGDWFVHPSYNLNLVISYRRSCSAPNYQNIPVRDPELAEIVRRCYIPRRGRYFVEIDFSQIEVRVGACYHKDPSMIRYIKDKSTDMHRDASRQMFLLGEDGQVPKEVRHLGKNGFVFPTFYGSVYFQMAPLIWDALVRRKLSLTDGTPLIEHLRGKGIKSLGRCDPERDPAPGTFEAHIQKVEKYLWDEMFPGYRDWKRDWYKRYQREGGFSSLVGFAWNGLFKRNEVNNFVIQCDSAQCLLKSLASVVKKVRKLRMHSLVVGEIHDSMQSDVTSRELGDFLDIAHEVMVDDLMRDWKWIIVPVETESEVSPRGESWHAKKEWKKIDGTWQLPPGK